MSVSLVTNLVDVVMSESNKNLNFLFKNSCKKSAESVSESPDESVTPAEQLSASSAFSTDEASLIFGAFISGLEYDYFIDGKLVLFQNSQCVYMVDCI